MRREWGETKKIGLRSFLCYSNSCFWETGNTDWMTACQSVNKSIKGVCVFSVERSCGKTFQLVRNGIGFQTGQNHQSSRCQRRQIEKIKIPPQCLCFPSSLALHLGFSQLASLLHTPVTSSGLGKERDCSQCKPLSSLNTKNLL